MLEIIGYIIQVPPATRDNKKNPSHLFTTEYTFYSKPHVIPKIK